MTDEFEIIERWFTRRTVDDAVRVGIGDDAAIVDSPGALAIAVDTLVAGTHFPDQFDPRSIGHRALAVNLSDLAAVSARPRWATLSLTLPAVEPDWLDAFAGGFFALAERYQVSLIGGDTTQGPLSITVTVGGDAARVPPLRSAGLVGDRVFVSGTLGDSAAALAHIGRQDETPSAGVASLVERFSYPEPRVALGRALDGVAHAAIDISDGLLADLTHICRASRCGARLDVDAVPLSDALRRASAPDDALQYALSGGDDYELCFTVAPEDRDRLHAAAAAAATPVTEIGELTGGTEITALKAGQSVSLEPSGYRHFAS